MFFFCFCVPAMRLLLHCCWYSFLPSNASTAVDYPDATRPSITTVSTVLNGFNFGWTIHFDTEFWKITILSVLQMWVERAEGGWKGLCCCCLSALWGYRLWLCKSASVSTLCQFVPLCFWEFRRPWLWLWVQPVPACLKSEWVFVGDQTLPLHPCDPSRRPKGWAWPRALHPLQKKWKKKEKIRLFSFPLQSPLPVSSSESKWDEPVLPHSERHSENETLFLFVKFLRLSSSFFVVWTFPLPF